MPRKPNRPCDECGKLLWPTKGGVRQVCRDCRGRVALARHRPSPVAVKGSIATCRKCQREFTRTAENQAYCWDPCRSPSTPPSAEKRNRARILYGWPHQRRRAALLPAALGTPCHLCGEVMDDPNQMHLDHDPETLEYRGFAHAACNILDGARRGQARLRAKKLANAAKRAA